MKRVLLAWEAGAGRGHVVTLARVARALKGIALCDAALGWMDYADEISPQVDLVYPGARLPYDFAGHQARKAPPNASWAEYLLDCHFADPETLKTNVGWWMDTIRVRQIDLVVADYAPRALLAARILGVPALAIGTGYGIPPADLSSFPLFLPDYSVREADEAAMVATINRTLGPLGFKPIAHLPQVYARAGEIVRTLPFLDPYAAWRQPGSYLPPVADYGGLAPGTGTELFCYFSTREFENPALVEALERSRLPIIAFVPNAQPEVRQRLTAAGVTLSDRPLPVAEIGRRARLVMNSGQHGILSLALTAGLPQVCLPQHLEQLYHARRVVEAGAGALVWPRQAPVEDILQTIMSAWNDDAMAQRARALAHDLSATLVEDDIGLLQQRLLPFL